MKRNLMLLWCRDALNAGAAALTSVSVLSGFFLHGGLSGEEISFYLALTPFVNFVVSLLFSGITGYVQKTIQAYSLTGLLTAAATYGFLFFCHVNVPHSIFFPGTLILGCLLSSFSALKNIFDYKQPCEVMDLSDYSVYVSINGIVSGIAGIVSGAALAQFYAVGSFFPVTAAAFLSAGLFLTAGTILNSRLDVLNHSQIKAAPSLGEQLTQDKTRKNRSVVCALFSDRDFLFLIIPNFVRGFGAGTISLIPVVAVSACNMEESGLALIAVCTYIATLISCILYAGLSKRFGTSLTGILGGIVFCIIIPCFLGNDILFFILYTFSYIGFNIMCCAIPESIYHNVSTEKISAFHTWRLALTTLGTSLSTALFGKFLDWIPSIVILAIGAFSVLVCVIGYYLCFHNRPRNAPKATITPHHMPT